MWQVSKRIKEVVIGQLEMRSASRLVRSNHAIGGGMLTEDENKTFVFNPI